MRLKFLFLLATGISLCFPQFGNSQNNDQEILQIQPIIMVIPFAKEEESLRTVLENNIELRVAVNKVKEGFDDRGYTTVDFLAKLKATDLDEIWNSANQTDLKTQLAAYSGADIYVEVEAYKNSGEGGNSARVNLSAYDAYTGRSLGNKSNSSNVMYSDKFDLLVEQALKKKERGSEIAMVADFLNVMQEKFTDMVENGRPIKIMFMLDNNVEFDFFTENEDGDQLSEVIDDWIADNAYKNNYNDGASLANRITYPEVRIPLRMDNGRNYTPKRFGRKIRKAFRKIVIDGAELSPRVETRGGTLYITFQ